MLAEHGTEPLVEPDAERAAGLMGEASFDAVIVDRAFGLEEAALLGAKGLAAGLRVIVLLTPAERHELGQLSASGMAGYLIKPVRAASLLAQVKGGVRPMPANDDGDGPEAQALAGLKVLLAEDNEINALVASTVLTRLGAEVSWAKDGAEAVALNAAGQFDAILMDMRMPGLDGLAATREIRAAEREQGRKRTPVYALTANVQAEDRDACLLSGMDAFLTKPIDRDGLAALLEPIRPVKSA
jgi:CheY-like chemotaxis protein